MIQKLKWLRKDERLLLFGKLNKDLVHLLWDVRNEVMKDIRCIDLRNISDADTAGIALLIHLIALAKNNGDVSITLPEVNNIIFSLVRLYNLPPTIFPK